MPIINVTITEEDGGATREQKEELARRLTDVFSDIFKRPKSNAVVTINEINTDNYAIGGKTITNIRKES